LPDTPDAEAFVIDAHSGLITTIVVVDRDEGINSEVQMKCVEVRYIFVKYMVSPYMSYFVFIATPGK